MDTSENLGCCRAVVEVDKALVAKEKEGRKEEVKEVSMLMMECCKEEGGEGKGSADKMGECCNKGVLVAARKVQRSSSAKGPLYTRPAFKLGRGSKQQSSCVFLPPPISPHLC